MRWLLLIRGRDEVSNHAHKPRRIVHVSVTEHPTAVWTAQQMVDAFPWDAAPRYLLRVWNMGIEEVIIAPHAPWQNPYVERLMGSIRRQLLDYVIVLNEQHLMRLLRAYMADYQRFRTYLSLRWIAQSLALSPPLTGGG